MSEQLHNNTFRFGFGGKEKDQLDWVPCTEEEPCESMQNGKCCERCRAALLNVQTVKVVDHSRKD
jgi:hypothetical protein